MIPTFSGNPKLDSQDSGTISFCQSRGGQHISQPVTYKWDGATMTISGVCVCVCVVVCTHMHVHWVSDLQKKIETQKAGVSWVRSCDCWL